MKNKKTKDIFDRSFKLKHFGYGEWLDEPDVLEFEYRRIKCLAMRIYQREPYSDENWFGGYLCGYIFLPKDHPLYGKEIGEIDLDCHRGVTYVENTEDGYMIGFDCSHFGDLIPTLVELRKRFPILDNFPMSENMKNYPWFKPVYRNIDYVVKELKSMVRQANKISTNLVDFGSKSVKGKYEDK